MLHFSFLTITQLLIRKDLRCKETHPVGAESQEIMKPLVTMWLVSWVAFGKSLYPSEILFPFQRSEKEWLIPASGTGAILFRVSSWWVVLLCLIRVLTWGSCVLLSIQLSACHLSERISVANTAKIASPLWHSLSNSWFPFVFNSLFLLVSFLFVIYFTFWLTY